MGIRRTLINFKNFAAPSNAQSERYGHPEICWEEAMLEREKKSIR
jgi:hypothetical protein